jgi:XTP/dITP diphosphohydrolase
MPWRYRPRPETIDVNPEIRGRVVELGRQDKVRGIRLLREETGLSLTFAVALVDSWLDGGR